MKAPVVEAMITTEEEEKIKDELFSRPSPTPQDSPDEEVKRGDGILSPALSPIHSPVHRLHVEESLSHREKEQEVHSLEHFKDKTISPTLQQATLPCTEDGDEMAEASLPEPSKPPFEETKSENGNGVPLKAIDSENKVQESEDIFQCSMGEEEVVAEPDDKAAKEVIEVEKSGENENMEIIEDDVVEGEEEPQNMVKLVFKEKKGSNGETEVSSGQPQNDAFRWGELFDKVIQHD